MNIQNDYWHTNVDHLITIFALRCKHAVPTRITKAKALVRPRTTIMCLPLDHMTGIVYVNIIILCSLHFFRRGDVP